MLRNLDGMRLELGELIRSAPVVRGPWSAAWMGLVLRNELALALATGTEGTLEAGGSVECSLLCRSVKIVLPRLSRTQYWTHLPATFPG